MMPNKPQKAQNFWPSFLKLLKLLGAEKLIISLAILLSLIGMAFLITAPIILGFAIDEIFNGALLASFSPQTSPQIAAEKLLSYGQESLASQVLAGAVKLGAGINFSALNKWLLLLLGCYLAGNLFDWLYGFYLNRAVMRVIFTLRQDIEHKLHRLPLQYFDANARGDIISRTTNDVDNIQAALQQAFVASIGAIVKIITVTIIMFVLSWHLALISLLALPLAAILMGVIGVPAGRLYRKQWAATGELNTHIEESFSGHELIRNFNQNAAMSEQFFARNQALRNTAIKAQTLSGIFMPATSFVQYLVFVLTAIIGALKVLSGTMTVGSIITFINYSKQFSEPVGEISSMSAMIQSGVASAERVFALLDSSELTEEATSYSASDSRLADKNLPVTGKVCFQQVDFSYHPDKSLIKDLSLTVEPGQTVAIVGPTGAGKTTLINLIMRFYEVNAGKITLDGIDIRDIPRSQLRQQIGMVLQDAFLFTGTIRENIRYGNLEASDEQVVEAAKATMVDHFVRLLPDGYDTVLTENATTLSAGERQLLTIARAFIANPSLLILDEATSSVDTRTEVLVQQAMNTLRTGRTSFVIAHRLSTIKDADLIIMMEDGKVVEQGTHTQLVAHGGAYAKLLATQFSNTSTED